MAITEWIGGDGAGTTDWSVAANHSGAAVPVNADESYVLPRPTMYDIAAGLGQSAVTLGLLQVDQGYTKLIGVAPTSGAPTYLAISASILILGISMQSRAPNGSKRVYINTGSNACVASVYNSASAAEDTGRQPIQLLGSHASNVLRQYGGKVAIATADPDETSNWPVIQLASDPAQSPELILGEACQVGTLDMKAGTLLSLDDFSSAVKTYANFRMYGGVATCFGKTAFTNLEIYRSDTKFIRRSDGTIATLKIGGGGEFDGSRETKAIIITNTTLFKDARLNIACGKTGVYTFSNKPTLSGCSQEEVRIITEVGDYVAP